VRAARLLGLAEAMGMLEPGQPIARLDRASIEAPVRRLIGQGIGRNAGMELAGTDDPERLAALLDRLYEELLASPSPQTEARSLGDLLGLELLGQLVGASLSSLRRYAAGERGVPDSVAARLHHLAVVVSHLAGGYNDFGIRRWFVRPRAQLAGQSPAEVLHGDWDAEDAQPQAVLHLAEALNSSPAT
jgi:hypothetical protein